MTSDPTVLIGLGATKAGTSWVHRYLSDHPDCYMRGIKELHYFDVLEGNGQGPDMRAEHATRLKWLQKHPKQEAEHVIRQIVDHEDWLETFDGTMPNDAGYSRYLREGLGERKLVADITPAYGVMGGEGWRHMVKVEPQARFLYLLRDPVDRLWSHVRMAAQRTAANQGKKGDEAFVKEKSVSILRQVLKGDRRLIIERSDYRRALNRLERFVDPDRQLLLFYENLFTQSTVDHLCDFLAISRQTALLEKRVHVSPDAVFPEALREATIRFLAPQYAAVEARMGSLPDHWVLQREAA